MRHAELAKHPPNGSTEDANAHRSTVRFLAVLGMTCYTYYNVYSDLASFAISPGAVKPPRVFVDCYDDRLFGFYTNYAAWAVSLVQEGDGLAVAVELGEGEILDAVLAEDSCKCVADFLNGVSNLDLLYKSALFGSFRVP